VGCGRPFSVFPRNPPVAASPGNCCCCSSHSRKLHVREEREWKESSTGGTSCQGPSRPWMRVPVGQESRLKEEEEQNVSPMAASELVGPVRARAVLSGGRGGPSVVPRQCDLVLSRLEQLQPFEPDARPDAARSLAYSITVALEVRRLHPYPQNLIEILCVCCFYSNFAPGIQECAAISRHCRASRARAEAGRAARLHLPA
jgi:hypothetical protein